jgi:hypothetical protein
MELDELTEAIIANLMKQNELLRERLKLEIEENYRHRQRALNEEENLQW